LHLLWRACGALTFVLLVSMPCAAQPATQSHGRDALRTRSTLAPATRKDVADALSRVFGNALVPLVLDEASTLIQGDFNGDGSRDLAVLGKPNPAGNALTELNDALSNWEVEDPTKVALPDPTKRVQRLPAKPPRAIIEKSDSLLVILHGVGTDGWRDARARQAYVLKNNSSSELSRLPKTRVRKPPHDRYFPALQGDVIGETLSAHTGIIYWTGAQYAFHADAPRKK
jgi:hypothetical protein